MTSASASSSSTPQPLLPPSDLLDWPPPLQPSAPPPKPGPALIGARTDGELLQALSLTNSSSKEPTFVLFGSSWCSHCHEMLGHFDAVAKTAYRGFRLEDEKAVEKPLPGGGVFLASLRAALNRMAGRKEESAAAAEEEEEEEEGGGGKEETKKKKAPSGRGRFVAARVDYMSRAASHVKFTPTVSVYRGAGHKKKVVDGFHGGDAQRLADRAWLHLGGGRRRWGWC